MDTDIQLIKRIIKAYPKHLQGDLLSECYLELDKIKKRFDPSKGTLQAFSYLRLHGRCKDFINSLHLNDQSLNDPRVYSEGETLEPIELLPHHDNTQNQIHMNDILELCKASLTGLEYKLMYMRAVESYSWRQIVHILGNELDIHTETTMRKHYAKLQEKLHRTLRLDVKAKRQQIETLSHTMSNQNKDI